MCMFVHMRVCACHTSCAEAREQLAGVGSFPISYVSHRFPTQVIRLDSKLVPDEPFQWFNINAFDLIWLLCLYMLLYMMYVDAFATVFLRGQLYRVSSILWVPEMEFRRLGLLCRGSKCFYLLSRLFSPSVFFFFFFERFLCQVLWLKVCVCTTIPRLHWYYSCVYYHAQAPLVFLLCALPCPDSVVIFLICTTIPRLHWYFYFLKALVFCLFACF